MAATLGDAEALLQRLRLLPAEPLDAAEALDRTLAEGFLLIQRCESSSQQFGWSNPSLFTGEAIFGALGLLLQGRSAAARLAAVPAFLEEAARNVHAAPKAWIARARRECTGGRLLLAGLDLPGSEAAAQAFGRFDDTLQRLDATEDYACGGEVFEQLLRHGHFLAMTVEELERLALERIAEAEAAVAASPPSEPEAPVEEPYLQRFTSTWQRAVTLAEEQDLLTFPDWPVCYVEQPSWVREAAPYLYFLP
jgi:hypothetical protein